METAMHAARLVATHSALLALLDEQQAEHPRTLDAITVTLSRDPEIGGLDVVYMAGGMPVSGEGA